MPYTPSLALELCLRLLPVATCVPRRALPRRLAREKVPDVGDPDQRLDAERGSYGQSKPMQILVGQAVS